MIKVGHVLVIKMLDVDGIRILAVFLNAGAGC